MSNERDFGETARFPRHEDQPYPQSAYAPSGGVYPVPPQAQPKQKRRGGAGTAFAVALVTALAAGGGAGYLAGGAGSCLLYTSDAADE